MFWQERHLINLAVKHRAVSMLSVKNLCALKVTRLLYWPWRLRQRCFPSFFHRPSLLWQQSPLQFHIVPFEEKKVQFSKPRGLVWFDLQIYFKNKHN